ncbi:MAG: family 16 glycoside hydrolase [Rubripirellula sp.]
MKSQIPPFRTIALASVVAIGMFAGGSVRGDAAKSMTESVGEKTSFNADWTFHDGEAKGAEAVDFDDSAWRSLNLPHDWAIEGPFDVKYNARCGGLPFHGTGWYRKTFQVPADAKGKIAAITFDGAMYNAHVWVNGTFVGNRPFGYIEFQYDISKHLRYGEENVISVRLKPEDLSSRWYPGAGLYRNVWLEYKNPLHLAHWGTFITTPNVQDDLATVAVETLIQGRGDDARVMYEVFDHSGEIVVAMGATLSADQAAAKGELKVANPHLWQLDDPYLYTLRTTVRSDGQVVDRDDTRFGIRTLKFTKKEGFFLNGKHTRIQGVCLHHDNGPLGAAINRRAIERKLQIMKQMGVNSIRTSHNPPSNELLDLCDEMGLLVQVEAFDVWEIAKVPNGYNKFFAEWAERDIKDMVRRDRNHPSVFMWSIGNEILEQNNTEKGNRVAKILNDYVKSIDTTRPTTCGFNYYPAPYKHGMAAQVDIAGMNYKPLAYGEPVDEFLPNNPVVGSETSSCTSSRGVYHLPIDKYQTHPSKQVTSYDIIGPPWAYPPDVEFDALEKHPEVLGEYIWTGFDYLGEPTPYGGKDNSTNGYWNADWPSRSSYFGAVDLCGFPKDRFYLYQSQWTDDPMVHLLPHWNWEGTPHETIPVFAYTNCDEAELFVNGKSMGRRVKGKDLTRIPVKFNRYESDHFMSKYRLSWDVPYTFGSIRVVGYIDGKQVAEKEIKTAGEPSQVKLAPDRSVIDADGYDLSYVTVRIEDADGNVCPRADNTVHFSVDGEGTIAAVGNGNAATTASFQSNQRDAFSGLCMLIVRSKNSAGEIRIKATSDGLQSDNVTLTTRTSTGAKIDQAASQKAKPKIVQYPNADVWTDAKLAAKEFAGFDFIGEYVKDGQAVQVTPSGDKFYLSIYQGGLPGSGWDNSSIVHQWVDLDDMASRLQGWKKIDRSETIVGKKPPEDATVLFDGSNVDAWNNGKIENGVLKAGAATKQKYRDFTLYLEFQIPLKPEPPISHPHRGNSGVFAVGAYEVQISDTFGLDHDPQAWEDIDMLKPVKTWSGSVYGIRSADQNMCLPPLTWQSMEIDFKAARFKDGVKTADAVISVIHNGVKVHDHVSLPEGTGGGPSGPRDEVAEGPIYLQNHGNPNRFRNIWIVPR